MDAYSQRPIDELCQEADAYTLLHHNDVLYIRDELMRLTKLDYKHLPKGTRINKVDVANLAYLTLFCPKRFQVLFLMEYSRLTSFLAKCKSKFYRNTVD